MIRSRAPSRARLLTRGGYDVVICEHAAGGLRAVTEAPTFALITDLHMPERSGLELLRSVRALSPSTFRVLYTGDSPHGGLTGGAAESLFHALVLKSAHFDALASTLARLHQATSPCSLGTAPKAEREP
jgi:DNA-binding NarL/FixJ family response regulator